ncbi:unnamed protein product, partial [Symbiodinium necroappetens]
MPLRLWLFATSLTFVLAIFLFRCGAAMMVSLQSVLRSFPPPDVNYPSGSLEEVLKRGTSSQRDALPEEGLHYNLDNPGSWGHPFLCRRPCVYVSKSAACRNAGCQFCHHTDHRRISKPDRSQRFLLQRFAPEQLVDLLLPHIRAKLREVGVEAEAEELLALLEAKKAETPSVLPCKERYNLSRRLQRMTVTSLISIIGIPEVDEAFEQVRMDVRRL